jgi:dTDP-L-rhamnose 4-epimerase
LKVLVTGGAGFIGSHTVDFLLRKGYEVRILDNLTAPIHMNGQVPDYVPLKHIEFIQGDVRDKSVWEQALKGIDAVYHLAAYQDYLPDFSTFFHTNTVSTALIYEVIVEQHLSIHKVIISSSQAVYGEGRYHCEFCTSSNDLLSGHTSAIYPESRPEGQLKLAKWDVICPTCQRVMSPEWTDESIAHPHNQYAISKYSQELIALNLGQRYNIPTVCMRYSVIVEW